MKKTVLVVPNYTHFGPSKDINRDSFLLVFKSFIENTSTDVIYHLPYPHNNRPGIINKFEHPNVEMFDMGHLTSFAPKMRVDYPYRFFQRMLQDYEYDYIWSHLPEWTNGIAVTRIYNKTQPIYGYCHWWEIKENGARDKNSFINNIQGILQMKTCGVNSKWVKKLVLKRAKDYFNDDVISKLDTIIQPHYLGCDPYKKGKEKTPSILFNHRDDDYTGAEWFFKEITKIWDKYKNFEVLTTLKDRQEPWVRYVGNSDRDIYLNNISEAVFGVGAFKNYSAWSMSVTDGLSVGVPYLLPKGLCYEEMVKSSCHLYEDREELLMLLDMLFGGRLDMSSGGFNVDKIKSDVSRLQWKNVLKGWDVPWLKI
jgi:hypothetical protein